MEKRNETGIKTANRKLIVFNMLSLDGLFSGTNGELDWHHVDEEFNEFAVAQLHSIDILLFGRKTYQLMANYWPTTGAVTDDPIVAGLMNGLPKIIFSKTLNNAEWNNTKLVKDNIEEEIHKLKAQTGKDMIILGSGSIVSALAKTDLIDEYRIIVNPVVLGEGIPLFNQTGRLKLELINTKVFKSGNILLYYKPIK